MPTTWNPSDKTAGTTLSNGDLTVVFTATGNGVRSIYSASAGKFYWEATFNSGSAPGIGFANASAVLSTVWATPTNAAVAFNGSIYVNNVSQSGAGFTINLGHTVAVAIDLGAQRIWFRNVTTSGNWNNNVANDPATNVGGLNIAALGTPLFALLTGNGTANWTTNFGATTLAGAVPSGFTAGFGPTNTTWSTTDKTASVALTNANLTATATGGSNAVRSTDKQITGKFYWETILTTASNFYGVGVAVGGAALPGMYSIPTGAIIVYTNGGAIWRDGINTALAIGSLSGGGALVCHALDATNGLYWVRSGAAGNWNGNAANNPVTGVGGISTFGSGFALYPAAVFGNTAATTANFTAGASAPNNVITTQAAAEVWGTTDPPLQVTQVAVEVWGPPNTTLLSSGLLRETLYAADGSLRTAGLVREVLRSGGTGGATFIATSGLVREVLRGPAVPFGGPMITTIF
jgi:hypothetical protein